MLTQRARRNSYNADKRVAGTCQVLLLYPKTITKRHSIREMTETKDKLIPLEGVTLSDVDHPGQGFPPLTATQGNAGSLAPGQQQTRICI